MFCSNCGTKTIDGAAFCQKCGAKLNRDNREEREPVPAPIQEPVGISVPSVGTTLESAQKTVKEKESESENAPMAEKAEKTAVSGGASSVPKSQEEIYAILEADTAMCHGVKSAKSMGSSLLVRGRTHVHNMIIMNGTAKLRSTLSVPFSLIDWILYLLGGWLIITSGRMGSDVVEYGYIYFEDYALPFALFLIAVGLHLALMPYIGYKEKASVRECIRKTVEAENISLTTNEMKPGIRFVISSIIVLAGVLVLIFGVLGVELEDVWTGSAVVFDDEDSDDTYDLDRDERVSLTQTYTNEDEGFSFMYPYDWEIEDVDDTLVYVACTGMFGTYASINVVKDIYDGAYFAATRSDFEEAYSYIEGLSDVKVMDLADMMLDGRPARKLTFAANNDIGVRVIEIQYIYILDSYVYGVTCAVEEDNYDRYEPRFNAIMNSYTIFPGNTSGETSYGSIFGEALMQLIMYNKLPDGSIANDLDGKIDGTYDRFAICDIDQDGEMELLINISSGSMAAAGQSIYRVNAARTGLEYVWSFDTDVTFYDTGFVKEDWSHNQGLSSNFWPYSIYQRTSRGYSAVGGADAWEKTYMKFDFEGNPFPDKVDLNRNGIIYFISDENGIDYSNPVDDAEYKKYEKRFFGDADELYIPWQSLKLDNVKAATGI